MSSKIEMADIVRALDKVRGRPVLTSNQCWDLAQALNAAAPVVERQPDAWMAESSEGTVFYAEDPAPLLEAYEFADLVDISPLYTSQPAPVSVPDGWRLVPLHPTMDMLDALMEWNKVGNVNAYNNILEAAPACLDKAKELNQ